MKPSFFSLYKRGRYFHPRAIVDCVGEANATATSRQTEERERFTVAALAFCLEYDASFREFFFERICQFKGDPALADWSLDIEPHDWSDLVLHNAIEGEIYSYVIECKVGASLAKHQDPTSGHFDAGYGSKLVSEQFYKPGSHVRYIVLGHRETLPNVECAVSWQQRFWRDVAAFPAGGITQSLFDTLGQMNIFEFNLRITNHMKITGDLMPGVNAGQLLAHVVLELGLDERYWRLWSSQWGDGNAEWCFGVDVYALPNHLQELVQPVEKEAAWFGYETHPESGYQLSVWFYCGNQEAAAQALSRVKPAFPQARIEQIKDMEGRSVIVSTKDPAGPSDRDWFVSVFRALGATVKV